MHSHKDAGDAIEKKKLSDKRINEYLKRSDITATRNEITNLKEKNKDPRKTPEDLRAEQLLTISLKETIYTIPVLLRILLELEAKIKKTAQPGKLQPSLVAIDDAISIFGETDRVLAMNFAKKALHLASLKHKTRQTIKGLEELVNHARDVEITEDTKALWQEISLYLSGIYLKTFNKIKRPRPCHRVVASVLPTAENLEKLNLKKHHASYVRFDDKLFYINQDDNIFTELKVTKEQCVQFDVSSPPRSLSQKELKWIEVNTQCNEIPKSAYLVVMTSPATGNYLSDLELIKPKIAYVRRGDELYYANKDTKQFFKVDFKRDDGLRRFDKDFDVKSGLRIFTDTELVEITKLTGHAHSRVEVAFREEDGLFPIADSEDYAFNAATGGVSGLTKMEISLYYHQAAAILDRKIQDFELAPIEKLAAPARQPAAAPTPSLLKSKGSIPIKFGLTRAATNDGVPSKSQPVVVTNTTMTIETETVVTEAPVAAAPIVEAPVETPVVEAPVVEAPAAVAAAEVPVAAIEAPVPAPAETPVVIQEQRVEPAAVAPAPVVDDLRASDELSEVADTSIIETSAAEVPVAAPAPQAASAYIESNMSVKEVGDKLVYNVIVSKEHEEFLREISDMVNDMLSNPLVDELKKHINEDCKDKLENFKKALLAHHLTQSQKAALSNFRDDVLGEINKYKRAKPSLFSYVYKYHLTKAKEAAEQLGATEDTEDHLLLMLDFNSYLREKESTHLLEYTSNSLLTAFDRLCPNHLDHHLAGKTSIHALDDDNVSLQIEVSKDHVEFLQQICDLVDEMLSNPLQALIKKNVLSKNDRLRISCFEAALKRFDFNPVQKMILANFKDDAIKVAAKYLEAWHPAHYQTAKNFIEKITEKKDDIRAQVQEVIQLHRYMYGKNSEKLLKGLNELLLDTLDKLCPKPVKVEIENVETPEPAVTKLAM